MTLSERRETKVEVWGSTRVLCPECESPLVFKAQPVVGTMVRCPHCKSDLEVLNVEPLELDWFYDWSWEDED